MWDLLFAVSGMSGAALCLFFSVERMARSRSARVRNMLALGVMALGAAYFQWLWNRALLATVVPHSGLIVLGNWFPLFAAVLCGITWSSRLPLTRRVVATGTLGAVALGMLIAPLLGEPPVCGNSWQGNICLQTTPHSCTPASAATLLRRYGIEATEAEMSNLCLTREGTTWLGLYRGLSLKTANSPWQVEVFEGSIADLRNKRGPVILVARLPDDDRADRSFNEACGWVPGQAHTVVFSRFLNEKTVVINDPTFGREMWRLHELETLWTGQAIRLVPRRQEIRLAGILRSAL